MYACRFVVAVLVVYYDELQDADHGRIKEIRAAAHECGAEVKHYPDLENGVRLQLRKMHAQTQSEAQQEPNTDAHTQSEQKPNTKFTSFGGFKFVLVLEFGERGLSAALIHDRIAGVDLFAGRKIAADLAHALDHLHAKKRIHADLKPLNSVRHVSTWQLIDMDASCEIDKQFGSKQPSSGYCPPEMARVLLAANENWPSRNVAKEQLSGYSANVAYDLWSFGVLLFHLVTGMPLWTTNQNDDLAYDDLQLVACRWNATELNGRFRRAVLKPSEEQKLASDLIRKLLEPTPEVRLSHFSRGCEMLSVLDHPFFQHTSSDTLSSALNKLSETTKQISTQLDEQHQMLQGIGVKVDQVLLKLNAHFQMLSTLLKGVESVAPKLICFLPVDAFEKEDDTTRWWNKAIRPRDWLTQQVLVFFIDPIQLRLAQTNEGKGFKISFPKAWVVKAMPYVKLGLATLRVAAIAGRLTGFPVPDIAGVASAWIDQQLKALDTLGKEAITSLSEQTKDPKLASELLGNLHDYTKKLASSSLKQVALAKGEPLYDKIEEFRAKIEEPLRKSVEELNTLLPDGWRKQSTAGQKVASGSEP